MADSYNYILYIDDIRLKSGMWIKRIMSKHFLKAASPKAVRSDVYRRAQPATMAEAPEEGSPVMGCIRLSLDCYALY